ncbi:MAG: phosphatidylglycerophosphatase A [Gammaproteobacteria bacterium]|nr:phosphatidylglycerophosphatase A [Gammaproteobacteria bacterium]
MKGQPLSPRLLRDPVHFFALGFGAGLSPKAPGTLGTLVGVASYAALEPLSLAWQLAVIQVGFALGIWLCGESAKRLGVHDHGGIVWDEIVGYWIAMLGAPAGAGWMLAGFALFRFFDIVKPWPIAWCDRRVHGGFGIMLDDVLAGLMAAGVLQAGVYLVARL